MKTEFLYQVIDEIEESYIEEAIKMQQNRKKDKPYLKLFLSAAAAAAVIFLFGGIFLQTNDSKQNPVTNYFPSEMKEHTFSLVVYAKESSENTTSQVLENSHEYTLSTEHGNVANKFYRLVSMDSISENIGQQTLPSDEEIMGYGFNVKIEGEGIESITYETEETEFLKKIEYPRNNGTEEQTSADDPGAVGFAAKEYYQGSNGKKYENCGNEEIEHWLFVPAGTSYTVPYDQQGSSDHLYALKLVYNKKELQEAQEYSYTHTEDEFRTINDFIINGAVGKEIFVTVNYEDGYQDHFMMKITHCGGFSMKVTVSKN